MIVYGAPQAIKCFDTIQQKRILKSIYNEKRLIELSLINDSIISNLKNIIVLKDNHINNLNLKYNACAYRTDYLDKLLYDITKSKAIIEQENSRLNRKVKNRKYYFIGGFIGGFLTFFFFK